MQLVSSNVFARRVNAKAAMEREDLIHNGRRLQIFDLFGGV
jgi:hypothetical protein